ncbi:MAG: tetratricopeptide repeat protein [Pseudomonadota bacterium]
MRLLILAAALLLMLSGPLRADQDDARLDGLFDQLHDADGPGEARQIEQRIWRVWNLVDDRQSARLLDQGNAAMAGRAYDVALGFYDQLVSRDPDFAEAWNRRATLNFMAGNYEASVIDIRRTLALEPRHFGALSGLGLIYMALDENEAAIRSFEAALDIHPHMEGPKTHIERLQGELEGSRI